jgi:hypothetical protein
LTAPGEHLELLKNAVRQSVAALTVVEVDTVARANELVDLLKFELNKRPSALLSLHRGMAFRCRRSVSYRRWSKKR